MFNLFKKMVGTTSKTANEDLKQKGTYSNLFTSQWKEAPQLGQNDVINFSKKVPEIKAMVDKISNTVATSEPKLYREVDNRKMPVLNSDLLDLLKFGNPLLPSGYDLFYVIQNFIENYGESFLLIERDSVTKLPKYLYPIKPSDVTELPKGSNDYKYKFTLNGQAFNAPLTEIIHIKVPNQEDIYGRGIGTLSSLLDTLQVSDYSEEYTKNYFYNDATPSYLINLQDADRQQIKEAKDKWMNENQGMFNQHKPYFVSAQNLQAIKMQDSFNAEQMIALSNLSLEKIQLSFGIPDTILGKGGADRASGQNDFEVYAQFCIKPRLMRIYSVLNLTLVKEFGDDLVLEYTNPVPSDFEKVFRAIQLSPSSFMMNELRELVGFDYDNNLEGQYMADVNVKEQDKMPLVRSDNPKSDEDIRRENE